MKKISLNAFNIDLNDEQIDERIISLENSLKETLKIFDSIINIKVSYDHREAPSGFSFDIHKLQNRALLAKIEIDPVKFVGDYLVHGKMRDHLIGLPESLGFEFSCNYEITGDGEDMHDFEKLFF